MKHTIIPFPESASPLHPVEELFALRAQIRALRAREAELRSYFLSRAGAQEKTGPFHQVVVRTKRSLVLNTDQLPDAIRNDPRYYKEQKNKTVRVERYEQSQQVGFATANPHGWSVSDPDELSLDLEFDVIEDFTP